MRSGREKTNWNLHLTLTTSNPDNTDGMQEKWVPIITELHMHLTQEEIDLKEHLITIIILN